MGSLFVFYNKDFWEILKTNFFVLKKNRVDITIRPMTYYPQLAEIYTDR